MQKETKPTTTDRNISGIPRIETKSHGQGTKEPENAFHEEGTVHPTSGKLSIESSLFLSQPLTALLRRPALLLLRRLSIQLRH